MWVHWSVYLLLTVHGYKLCTQRVASLFVYRLFSSASQTLRNTSHHRQQCAEHTKTTRVVVLTLTWFNAAVHYGRKNSVVISSSIRPTSLNIRRK